MVAAQNAAASGSTSACLTSAMEGYGAATYGDAIADVYDQWYSTRLDPTAAVDLLAELAGSGAVLELLSERVAQLNREKEALLQAVSVDQRTGLANAAAFDADHAQLHASFERSAEPYSVVLVDVDLTRAFPGPPTAHSGYARVGIGRDIGAAGERYRSGFLRFASHVRMAHLCENFHRAGVTVHPPSHRTSDLRCSQSGSQSETLSTTSIASVVRCWVRARRLRGSPATGRCSIQPSGGLPSGSSPA